MQVIVVDDETSALENMENKLSKLALVKKITLFSDSILAFEHLATQNVDVAFLDIEMYEMSGLELAKKIKEISPNTNIVFVTGHSQYMKNAFTLHVSGYLTKPVSTEQLQDELYNLRHPITVSTQHTVKVQTFGNFDAFFNNRPIKFQYTKTKELLAFLADRQRAMCTNGEIMAAL